MSTVYIIGHKNPDTDSIASAYAYAKLKGIIDPYNTYIPARCGNFNNQTRYIFQATGAQMPSLIKNVLPRVSDIMVNDVICVNENDPVLNVFHIIEEGKVRVVPVVDKGKHFKGIVGSAELISLFIQEAVDQRPKYVFTANNIPEAIKGSVLHKGESPEFRAALMIGAMSMERSSERMEYAGADETLLVVGNRKELIEYAVSRDIPAIIITGIKDKNEIEVNLSGYKGWIFLSSLDSAETVRRVILASPIRTIMNKDVPSVSSGDYIETAQDIIVSSHHRAIPVVDNGELTGVLTRTDLLKKFRNKVILVDHNEPGQAVDGIETADVLEIIDHHRLGAVKTTAPVTFYAKPVGSTCTLVYQLYKNNGITPDKQTAMVMMSGIISDTVMLKSPTVTNEDIAALKELEKIAGVDAKEFGMEVFSATDNLSARTPENIVTADFKMYSEYGLSVGIGQVEVVTTVDLKDMHTPILDELERQKSKNGLSWAMLLVTDIIKEESVLLCTDLEEAERLIAYKKLESGCYFLPGILSRKKQLLPEILRIAEEMQ